VAVTLGAAALAGVVAIGALTGFFAGLTSSAGTYLAVSLLALVLADTHLAVGTTAIYAPLRDLVSTILETRLTIQGNRLNEIMKKLTSWAAITAIPTAISGFYGQNVPYPGFQQIGGFISSMILILTLGVRLSYCSSTKAGDERRPSPTCKSR
jgi:uncharacterized membrane protein YfcA